jgi:hypothetical protein
MLGADNVRPFGRGAALVSGPLVIDRLGGSVKVARILSQGNVTSLQELPLDIDSLPYGESKTPFGLSAYGTRDSAAMLRAAGLTLKKRLKKRGSVRLIMPARGLAVSAAELHHNQVIRDGFEIIVACSGDHMIVAQTIGVQDIDWYSKRDFGRPRRSAKIGMLPPKLAQILINTTKSSAVYDPFCGTGVVLQEALLMGRKAGGSDTNPDMVLATRSNLEWLSQEVQGNLPEWQVHDGDARAITPTIGASIVSEGYLGPNMAQPPRTNQLVDMQKELGTLYRESLAHWARSLATGDDVAICVPAWRVGRDWHYLNLVDEMRILGYTLKSFAHVPSSLLYARDDQVVGRQLLLLRKN